MRTTLGAFAIALTVGPLAGHGEPPDGKPNGHPILPPKWAFGVLYGSYHTQAEVTDDVDKLRSGGYGGDLYWVDSSWVSADFTRARSYLCFRFDESEFPDPKAMIGALADRHFRFGVWEWPRIDRDCPLFAIGKTKGYFIKGRDGAVLDGGGWHGNKLTGVIDYTNPNATAWWKQLHAPLLDLGVGFFKLDTEADLPKGAALADAKASADRYKALYRQTGWELSAKANGGRGFILTHVQASTAADQTPGMWTGDSQATFDGLKAEMQVASTLNDSAHTAMWCGDTGGYHGDPTAELYMRWLEYSAFTPCQEFFGAKTTSTISRFPWTFGAEAQRVFRTYTRLRYRLLPFRYSNAQAAYHEQPLTYPVRWLGTTQLVVGSGDSEILIQPVTTAGANSTAVALPSGADWIDFWTDEVHPGGTSPTIATPVDREPVLVKAGSILVMGPAIEWVEPVAPDPLTLVVYPSAGATSYTYYEDDGVSDRYITRGEFGKTVFAVKHAGARLVVSIGKTTGSYSNQPSSRNYVIEIHGQSAPRQVQRDGVAQTDGWSFDPATRTVSIKLRVPTRSSTEVVLSPR